MRIFGWKKNSVKPEGGNVDLERNVDDEVDVIKEEEKEIPRKWKNVERKVFYANPNSFLMVNYILFLVYLDLIYQFAQFCLTLTNLQWTTAFSIYGQLVHLIASTPSFMNSVSLQDQRNFRIMAFLFYLSIVLFPMTLKMDMARAFTAAFLLVLWSMLSFGIASWFMKRMEEWSHQQIPEGVNVMLFLMQFILAVLFLTYVYSTYFFFFNPFKYADKLRQHCVVQEKSDLVILKSSAFEIVLENRGKETFQSNQEFVTREIYLNEKFFCWSVEFMLPKECCIKPGKQIRLIPEHGRRTPNSFIIQGFRCFGYDVADEIRTEIATNFRESLAERYEKFTRLDGTTRRYQRAEKIHSVLWQEKETTFFDQMGNVTAWSRKVRRDCQPRDPDAERWRWFQRTVVAYM